MVTFPRDVLADVQKALTLEWLETDGLGGFASSTVLGINTRRYHALLVAATTPPTGRMVMLSRVEDALLCSGSRRFDLASALYPGATHPQGHQNLCEFRLDPFPTFIFGDATLTLKKTVCMPHGHNTVVVSYELVEADEPVVVELRPLVAGRDYHALVRANPSIQPAIEEIGAGAIAVSPYGGVPTLRIALVASTARADASFSAQRDWYYNHEYPRERERGLDDHEDLFAYGVFRVTLAPGRSCALVATTERDLPIAPLDIPGKERARRRALTRTMGSLKPAERTIRTLAAAADHFLVARGDGQSIIAGYHWFTDWTRDSMISLPGLLVATGRLPEAKRVLETFAAAAADGVLPNRFADDDVREFTAVDASLWFAVAAHRYLAASGDADFGRFVVAPAIGAIADAYLRGAAPSVRIGDDGLVSASAPGLALTWMDARVGDWVVTPRGGKPVEVNALWYNALRIQADLTRQAGDDRLADRQVERAEDVRASFARAFWNDRGGYLNDLIREDGSLDECIRPNQLFAIALPFPLIDGERARSVLDIVDRHLLTPFGLRTLSPRDPSYIARYGGEPRARDSGYHQGTVWPWLLGPFVDATIAVRGATPEVLRSIRELLAPLSKHVLEAGVGFISEVFDADAPHAAGGCIAQAWSVAEVLRVSLLAQGSRLKAQAPSPTP